MKRTILVALTVVALSAGPCLGASPTVSGELKQWHKITVTVDGPQARETDSNPNPFTDYRMTVVFTHESGAQRYAAPGYFAADGNAAETSGDFGNKWRKEEFKSLRQEILQLIESERQYLNLSLVAFGAGVGLAPFISSQKAYVVLLILPLVFHVLLSETLKSMRSVGIIASYLMKTLIPRVNEILDLLGSKDRGITALGWEIHTNEKWAKPTELIASSLTPSRHWIPILAIGGLLITYALVVQNAGYTPSKIEFILILVNLILLIWAAIQNIAITRIPRKKRE